MFNQEYMHSTLQDNRSIISPSNRVDSPPTHLNMNPITKKSDISLDIILNDIQQIETKSINVKSISITRKHLKS